MNMTPRKANEEKGDLRVGLQGCNARASIRRCNQTMLPSVPVGLVLAVVEKPYVVIRDARTFCKKD